MMEQHLPPRRLGSSSCDEDDDELHYVFVEKWEHSFDGMMTQSETRWVFDREDWQVVCLQVFDPATLEWVSGTPDEILSVTTELNDTEAQYLEDVQEWRLSESDDLPDWACTQAELDERFEIAIREQLAESRRRNAIRLQLPRGAHVRTVTVQFSRPDGYGT